MKRKLIHSHSKKNNSILKGIIECAAPNPEIYRFDSRLKLSSEDSEYVSLSEEQLLLQGFSRN